jgi:LPXTG-site transpeptidase (sortase) family protein
MTEVPFDTSSVITGNTISGFVYGIRFDTEGLYTVQSVVQENIITENTTVGLLASTALQVSGSFDLMVSQNCIYNNATGLTWQDPAVSLDARNNYWGSALGPTHPSNATGDGDVITGDVNFVPWLNSCQLLPTPTPTATATATATMTSTPEPTATGSPGDLGSTLPDTGFAPGLMTDLGVPETHYFDLMSGYVSGGGMSLIIPTLGVSSPVLGVPANETGWNVRWLGNYVGWLAGSAFPTWEGNTVLTGHVYNSTGEAGVFVNLNRLSWGDRIVIEAWGQEHVYEVRSVKYVASDDVRSVMQHEEQDWLTLVTCYGFNEATGKFDLRVVVRAIRID